MKKTWTIILFVLTVMTTGYVWQVDTRNFQTVVPGKVYRSGK